jgi:arylsulfatase A-like enzyme
MKHYMLLLFLIPIQPEICASEKPNILLLFADDASFADFGFHGSKEMNTPHLDQLAKEGVRFTKGYVTASVCGPSRAGLITGKYQQRFGFEENNVPGFMSIFSAQKGEDMGIPLDERTLADYLKSLGYQTAFFGKWHLGGADRFHPSKRGFDEFYGFRGGARSFFAFISFNAVHTPMDAIKEDLEQFPELTGKRKELAAMTLALDRAELMKIVEQFPLPAEADFGKDRIESARRNYKWPSLHTTTLAAFKNGDEWMNNERREGE